MRFCEDAKIHVLESEVNDFWPTDNVIFGVISGWYFIPTDRAFIFIINDWISYWWLWSTNNALFYESMVDVFIMPKCFYFW